MSETVKKPCKACGNEMPVDATFCVGCKLPQSAVQPCRLCAQPIPVEARRCNACSAHQRGWRRWLPLPATVGMLAPAAALLTAIIITVIPFGITQWTNLVHRHSNTRIAFAGIEGSVIYAHLWNTGLRPSSVRGYHLSLGSVHVEDVDLIPIRDATHEVRSLVPPGGEVTMLLLVRGLQRQEPFTHDDVTKALAASRVTLEAVVDESNRSGERRSDLFDAEWLRDLILLKLH